MNIFKSAPGLCNNQKSAIPVTEPVIGRLETLESRVMLAVTTDADGWTVITKSSDTRVVHVSSSSGNDSNSGLSSGSPVRSLGRAKSLMRDGRPDWMLLKRGDVWYEALGAWGKSGRDADEPMLIGAYGSGNRPLLKTGDDTAFNTNGWNVDDLAIVGLHFYAHTRDTSSSEYRNKGGSMGLRVIGDVDRLLVEDVVVDSYTENISFNDYDGRPGNVTIRRSVIVDSYHGYSGGSSGIYASGTDGILIEENVIDHNGWHEKNPGTAPGHNIYIQSDTTGLVVRDNIIANAGSHGLQARSGGIVKDNLFLRNPIGMSFGLVNGAAAKAGGVSGAIEGNVFLDTRDISVTGRGWGFAIEIGNTKKDGNTVIRDNIFAHDSEKKASAINLGYGSDVSNRSQEVGINDLTIENNVIYNWYRGMSLHSGLVPGGTGYKALNDLVVRNNDFQQVFSNRMIMHSGTYKVSEELWSNNRYYDDSSTSGWFSIQNSTKSIDSWRSKLESTAKKLRVSYDDASRNISTYNEDLGGSESVSAFLKEARKQSKSDWREDYCAESAVEYIEEGFSV